MGPIAVEYRTEPGSLSWPFLGLHDEQGRSTGFVALMGPVRTRAERDRLAFARERVRLVGFTSFLSFPRIVYGDEDVDYEGMCDAWCHCFRRPSEYLSLDRPRALLPHSDFTDPSIVSAARLRGGGGQRRFDFVYVCGEGYWSARAKNWELALRCLPVLCGGLGLDGLVVGRSALPEELAATPEVSARLTVTGELPWADVASAISQARFVFVPNLLDPSPRVIAEALALDTPVLVNRDILGGWHYVNPFTGEFFESESDLAAGARRCLTRWVSPRRWFSAHHGPVHAGRRLARLLAEVGGTSGTPRCVRIADASEFTAQPGTEVFE